MKRLLLFLLVALALSDLLKAQICLVENSKPKARIVLTTHEKSDAVAANLLNVFVKRISGVSLQVIQAPEGKKGDIIFNGIQSGITEDGFRITTIDNNLKIWSGGDKGSIYAIVTLLEQYLGIMYFGNNEYVIKPTATINLPRFDQQQIPAFRYRQSQSYALNDTIFKMWYRLEEPAEVFAGGYWVHTFDQILPSSVYGASHPEYYSYFNGKRHPGKASQWCLTNPEVFELVSKKVDSIFKANPNQKIISISQNDGNFTNCTCENCKKIDDEQGALSGSLIYFLNKLAARFTDKEFSTLAYLFTMNPPKHLKPLPNVNIMLCDIDCNREVSLTENPSGREFVHAMEGWSKITNNIFLWDYGINFDNYVAPFPNLHILQDNIRLFKKNNVTMHFSQIASNYGGDFAELRSYMVSKLMWNPEANADSLMQTFLNAYYGKAAPYIYQYIKIMQGALIGSGNRLWIYDSPVSHKKGMLKPELMYRYNALFDQAEVAVASNKQHLERVQRQRLTLQYSELEIARTETQENRQEVQQKLALFESRVKVFNIPTLNERNNPPLDYCQLYRERYLSQNNHNLAKGAKIIYLSEPTGNYQKLGETALTDELFGGSTFVESWVGWEGKDASLIVDLGQETQITSIETDFLYQLGAWILLPTAVDYSYSTNNQDYTLWGNHKLDEDRSVQVKFVGIKQTSAAAIKARYIKVNVTGTKVCPPWHYGVGHPSWFFIDEITIK
jgi:hypothetical protein